MSSDDPTRAMNWENGLSLGALIGYLERLPEKHVLRPGLGSHHSYRGYYECLAFAPLDSCTAAEALSCARSADGVTHYGYKGGEYVMGLRTECYIAHEGSTGAPITQEWIKATWEQEPEIARLSARVAALEAERDEAIRKRKDAYTDKEAAAAEKNSAIRSLRAEAAELRAALADCASRDCVLRGGKPCNVWTNDESMWCAACFADAALAPSGREEAPDGE